MAYITGIALEWAGVIFRWAHIVAAIGWIGSSFYFMWLDATLRRRANMPEGVKGENWTVHGGGFYHTRKYLVAPESMPEDLHWFRLESYFTWLTGFALMFVTYYWSASSFLLDSSNTVLDPWQGVFLSIAGMAGGWLLYDWLCRSSLASRPVWIFAILFAAIVLSAWAYGLAFSGRATFVQVGAMIATIMTGNVLFVIIPNQRIVVAVLRDGGIPNPAFGEIAKLRSTHNNYLTLPVIFLMLSNHYPVTFGSEWNWGVVAVILVVGAIVRDWFNRYEAGERGWIIWWNWPAAAALMLALAVASAQLGRSGADPELEVFTPEAVAILQLRCQSCHSVRPVEEGYEAAPAGVALDTIGEAKRHAARILAQTVLSDAMPPGNLTGMTEEERSRVRAWILAGTPDE